jgi:adenylate cyclase class 2
MEAECKYRISDLTATMAALESLSAVFLHREQQRDTYLRHPSRNFRETDEALRMREIDGQPFITYKGPRLSGPIKIRPEIELPLVAQTVREWLQIWENLGFSIAAQVCKTRDVYRLSVSSLPLTIAVDRVESLGVYVEIERIVSSSDEIEQAKRDIQAAAKLLSLQDIEPRSYLSLILSGKEPDPMPL